MILTRAEFLLRWRARKSLGKNPTVRVRIEHTHIDSFFTEILEGWVGAVEINDDVNRTESIRLCIGGDGRHGNGRWVTGYMGSEVTALGTSKHLTITVELLDG